MYAFFLFEIFRFSKDDLHGVFSKQMQIKLLKVSLIIEKSENNLYFDYFFDYIFFARIIKEVTQVDNRINTHK